jgi:hypothetical protein
MNAVTLRSSDIGWVLELSPFRSQQWLVPKTLAYRDLAPNPALPNLGYPLGISGGLGLTHPKL